MSELKTCTKCKLGLPIEMFRPIPSRPGRLFSVCKKCSYARAERWRAKNKEKLAKVRDARKLMPGHREERTNHRLKKFYGMTLEDRNSMINAQGGECGICLGALTDPCVDHCHHSGKIRSILCRQCNCLLGMAKEKISTLQSAIKYLESHLPPHHQ